MLCMARHLGTTGSTHIPAGRRGMMLNVNKRYSNFTLVCTNVIAIVCVCYLLQSWAKSAFCDQRGHVRTCGSWKFVLVMSYSFGIQSRCSHQNSMQCMHGVESDSLGLHIYMKLSTCSTTTIWKCSSPVRSSPMCWMHLGHKTTDNIYTIHTL